MNKEHTFTIAITLLARDNETDKELIHWLFNRIYEIGDIEKVELKE